MQGGGAGAAAVHHAFGPWAVLLPLCLHAAAVLLQPPVLNQDG